MRLITSARLQPYDIRLYEESNRLPIRQRKRAFVATEAPLRVKRCTNSLSHTLCAAVTRTRLPLNPSAETGKGIHRHDRISHEAILLLKLKMGSQFNGLPGNSPVSRARTAWLMSTVYPAQLGNTQAEPHFVKSTG